MNYADPSEYRAMALAVGNAVLDSLHDQLAQAACAMTFASPNTDSPALPGDVVQVGCDVVLLGFHSETTLSLATSTTDMLQHAKAAGLALAERVEQLVAETGHHETCERPAVTVVTAPLPVPVSPVFCKNLRRGELVMRCVAYKTTDSAWVHVTTDLLFAVKKTCCK